MSRKRSALPSPTAPTGIERVWLALTSSLRPRSKVDHQPPTLGIVQPASAAPVEPAGRPLPAALSELFLAHPAARRMFPNLWRLARIWALPGSTPLTAAAPELLRSVVRELDGLVTEGQPRGLHLLRLQVMRALTLREDTQTSTLDDDGLRSRFGHERLEVGEASMDAFVQEEMAWTKTRPGRLPGSG